MATKLKAKRKVAARRPRTVYFDPTEIGEPEVDYVCWVDVMGTWNQMARSVPAAAAYIYGLHCAVLAAQERCGKGNEVRLYPVMDGVFMTSARRGPITSLLGMSLRNLAETFMRAKRRERQFLLRGGIAYGPVVHGAGVRKQASLVLSRHPKERDSILVGLPMLQAREAADAAPPFGIGIHESARTFSPDGDWPFLSVWWRWHRVLQFRLDKKAMLGALEDYFKWYKGHIHTTGYDPERIKHHRSLAREYFGG